MYYYAGTREYSTFFLIHIILSTIKTTKEFVFLIYAAFLFMTQLPRHSATPTFCYQLALVSLQSLVFTQVND